jgi:DNA-binding NarL/FixJ family response regulator
LLADHSAWIAAQIRDLLQEAFEVVGVVGSGAELERAFESLAPEVAIVEVRIPGAGAVVGRILERHPGARMVFLGAVDASPTQCLGLPEGAHGYVLKEDAADELVSAVEAARRGRAYVSGKARGTRPLRRRKARILGRPAGAPRSTGWSPQPRPNLGLELLDPRP